MADSASDPKVDDVLSSVRRLVSQEMPKRASARAAMDPGALVLSSKDRIEAEHSRRAANLSLEQRIAELEAAVDKSTSDFEPDGSEDQSLHRPDRIVYTRPRSSERAADAERGALRLSEIALLETAPEPEAERIDAPVEFRRGTSKPSPEAPMAEDVPPLPPTSADVRAFSDPDDVVARIEARIARGGDLSAPEVTPEPEPDSGQVDPFAEPDVDAPLEAVASLAENADVVDPEKDTLSDLPAFSSSESPTSLAPGDEMEAVTDPAPQSDELDTGPVEIDQLPEDREGPVDIAQAAILTARAQNLNTLKAEKKPTGEVKADHKPTALERADAALATLADEDAMRLLVGRLLREELQGDLGERITQNVRKLVRSEIKRVLQSRELD